METATMKHAMEAEGPFMVELDTGDQLKVAEFDGGGMDMDTQVYEVHGHFLDGGFAVIPQRNIKRVTDVRGEEVEFGNRWVEDHPRFEVIPGYRLAAIGKGCGACSGQIGTRHHGECQGYPEAVTERDLRRRCHFDPRRPDTFDGEEV